MATAKVTANTLDPKVVGRTIRIFRLKAGYAQTKLAKAADLDVKTISRLENGDFLPSLETVVALSRALGRSIDELVGLAAPPEASEEDEGDGAARRASLEARVAELERFLKA
jgi:transcriptional regulator with XRE-family HTH domain